VRPSGRGPAHRGRDDAARPRPSAGRRGPARARALGCGHAPARPVRRGRHRHGCRRARGLPGVGAPVRGRVHARRAGAAGGARGPRGALRPLQLLHCIRADPGGGETTLVDGFAVAEILGRVDPEAHDLLASHEVGFRYRDEAADLRARFPVLRVDRDGAVAEVRWNTRSCEPFAFEAGLTEAYYRAYRAFGRLAVDPLLVRRLALAPGDVVVLDNLRVLHGRTAIVAPGARHLQGC
jgi:hypothetical protein